MKQYLALGVDDFGQVQDAGLHQTPEKAAEAAIRESQKVLDDPECNFSVSIISIDWAAKTVEVHSQEVDGSEYDFEDEDD